MFLWNDAFKPNPVHYDFCPWSVNEWTYLSGIQQYSDTIGAGKEGPPNIPSKSSAGFDYLGAAGDVPSPISSAKGSANYLETGYGLPRLNNSSIPDPSVLFVEGTCVGGVESPSKSNKFPNPAMLLPSTW